MRVITRKQAEEEILSNIINKYIFTVISLEKILSEENQIFTQQNIPYTLYIDEKGFLALKRISDENNS